MVQTPLTSPLHEASRKATGGALQNSLVDLIGLVLIAKQAHWNVIGPDFRSVHLQLDELVALARKYTDEVAERAATIGVSPDGHPGTTSPSCLGSAPSGQPSSSTTRIWRTGFGLRRTVVGAGIHPRRRR